MRDARLMQAIYGQVWAIEPSVGSQMLAVAIRHAANEKLSDDAIRAAIDGSGHAIRPRGTGQASPPGVAVIQIFGVISSRSSLVENASTGGGTSAEMISRRFKAAMNDPEIQSIIFDAETPGGAVFGIPELANEIMIARSQKHIYFVANSMAASAGFWIGSAATTFVASPSAQVGSIGVLAAHENLSGAMEKSGIRVTLIHHGENKIEQSPFGPLSDDARAHMQNQVNQYGERFIRDVAASRNTTPAIVASRFGGGRMYGAQEALSRGMIDRVATLDEIVTEARTRKRGLFAPRQANAYAQLDQISAAHFPKRERARAELDQIEADARFPKRAAARAELDKLDAASRRRSIARARLALLV